MNFAEFRNIQRAVKWRLITLFLYLCAPALQAQTLADAANIAARPHLSFNGTPGLLDMPSAFAMPDADMALTIGGFGGNVRGTLAFQVLPNLTGVFRYSQVRDFDRDGDRDRFDRSFDLIYQFRPETARWPAIAVGLRDFGGTGLFESEYLVASKTLGPRRQFEATLGLGWGRLASQGGFKNPLGILASEFETRPVNEVAIDDGTGEFEIDRFFRGDAAAFGGLVWRPTGRLAFVAEYSSDAYELEAERGLIDINSSYNFGVSYQVSSNLSVSAAYLYGSEIGVRVSYVLNPKVPAQASGIEPGPQPVQSRPDRRSAPQVWSTTWVQSPATQNALQQAVIAALAPEGLLLEYLRLSATEAHVTLRNRRFGRSAQAVGRSARALTRTLPASVETFHITLTEQGMATTRVTVKRSDLEELEFAPDNAWQSYVRADISDAGDQPNARRSITAPRFRFAATGYVESSVFDPDQPFTFDAGVRGTLRFEPRPGWVLATSVRQPLYSNRDNINRVSNSVIQTVRSEQDDFNRGNGPKLDRLTLAHYFRPGRNLYGRVTAGYLEIAYAGVSGEILWKPTTSRLALGVEVNAVHQREPGDVFALGEGQFDYDVLTGHASAYYAMENGFHAQVDVGRYLAGDWGSTFTLSREFRNGWQVGAFFTLTDVSFDDFGEGSFDKGIFVTIPTSWGTGQPSRQERTSTIRPILRDGGARVSVDNRLYDLVREDSDPLLSDSWGRFWR
ncbi:MAG: YjbH domain-containing protein [Rhodobacteraceae bacterium]|nr:YjbH domain-containing protein [Paracoccaceae bacterium]